MTQLTDLQLKQLSTVVKTETASKANTALRIGTLFENIIDSKTNNLSGSTGNPAGSNSQIQFNSNGSFGAFSGFTFNSTTKKMVIGSMSLNAPTSNYFLGENVGNTTVSGLYNVGLGGAIMQNATIGTSNVGIGIAALQSLTQGNNNIGIGPYALNSVTDSPENIGIGFHALWNMTGFEDNVGIGFAAGDAFITGRDNIFLGYYAGSSAGGGIKYTNGDRSVFIGTVNALNSTESGQMNIQNAIFGRSNSGTTITSNGKLGFYVTNPTAKVHLPAVTTAPNTAPLKFTSSSGVTLSTPENGAVEFDGTHYYGTIGSTRYQLDQQGGGTVATFAQALSGTNNTTIITPLRNRQVNANVYNVEAYGALHNGKVVLDGVRTSSSGVIQSISGLFTPSDVGKIILVSGDGTSGIAVKSTIVSYQSPTQITMAINAPDSKSGCMVLWGTDDTNAIQSAINACFGAGGGTVYIPNGIYIIDGALQTSVLDGQNPNSQLYIPQTLDNTRTSITIQGESTNQYLNARTGLMSYKGSILWSTIQSVSGINPSVIGSRNLTVSNGDYQGFNDAYFRNFGILLWSNKSKAAPLISGINGKSIGKVSFKSISVNIDYLSIDCANPSTGSTFGIFVGTYADNGPNIVEECSFSGLRSAMILGEHTYVQGGYIGECYYGVVILTGAHLVSGWISVDRCAYQIFIPNTTFNDTVRGTTSAFIEFNLEFESQISGRWYDTQYLVGDAGNNGKGILRVDNPGTTPIDGASRLSICDLNIGILPKSYSMGHGGSAQYVQPGWSFPAKNIIFEQYIEDLLVGATDQAAIRLTNIATNSGGIYTSEEIVYNRAASKSIIQRYYLTGVNNETGREELYTSKSGSGSAQNLHTIDLNQYRIGLPLFYLAQYSDDASADSAAGGSASDGAEYYNTTTHKKKLKENGTWKTITTT